MTTTPAKVKTVSTPEGKPNLRDVLRGQDGFAEIAVETMFRKPLAEMTGTWIARVAVFLLERKAGADDVAAYKAAMAATIDELDGMFADDEDDEAADLGLEGSTRPEA